jgi:hypothetical protein
MSRDVSMTTVSPIFASQGRYYQTAYIMDDIISSAEETPEEESLTRDDIAETG